MIEFHEFMNWRCEWMKTWVGEVMWCQTYKERAKNVYMCEQAEKMRIS